ncbi:MAG: hypothetical protein C0506_13975 [Anaerolinea sp.]|nr:hypothetical protein [Anaerolinea sp.]
MAKEPRTGVQHQADLTVVRYQLPTVFSPGSPVTDTRFLAGRAGQIDRALAAVAQVGQHAVIYGERGVGKTSVASLIHMIWTEYIKDYEIVAARVQCDPTDTYASVWQKVAEAIQRDFVKRELKPAANGAFDECAAMIEAGNATPTQVTNFFDLGGKKAIVVIDEFDTVEDYEAPGLMASTIKQLSDFAIDATVVLVGVADSVDDLIAEHASIDRCLVQVFMPRMSPAELTQIVESRLLRVGMTIEPKQVLRIAGLAQGFPYYAHLLGLHSAIHAADARRSLTVQAPDVNEAIKQSITQTQQSILTDYTKAITSPRPENLYKQTLLACALTKADDLGYFAPADVKEPMTRVMKKARDVPSFVKQIKALTDSERGPALEQAGEHRKLRFRFAHALLKPYVVFRGVDEGLIDESEAYQYAQPDVARQLSLFDA